MSLHHLRAIEGTDLVCVRGGREVFRGVNFRIESGGVLAVEGPNGSGKTSLLSILAGLLPQASGEIRLEDDATGHISSEERGSLIGWLGHRDAAKTQLTPRETLQFFACFFRAGTEKIQASLEAVGLARAADLPCQYLSAGQKKRVALARLALSAGPLWLLDEPLAGLDAQGKTLAADMVQDHVRAGGIAIVATHEALGAETARLRLG